MSQNYRVKLCAALALKQTVSWLEGWNLRRMRVETVQLQSDSWIFNYGESERTNSGWGIMSERLRNWEKDADWDFVSQTAAYTFPSQKWRTIIGLTAALRILHHQCSRVAQQELSRDLVIRTKAEQAIKSTALVTVTTVSHADTFPTFMFPLRT